MCQIYQSYVRHVVIFGLSNAGLARNERILSEIGGGTQAVCCVNAVDAAVFKLARMESGLNFLA